MKLFVILFVFMYFLIGLSFAQESGCDYSIEILLDSYEFTKENFTWRMKAVKVDGISTNITGTAKIESGSDLVKSYSPWTNLSISKQKTSSIYSPNLEHGEYKLTAEITVECNDAGKDNNIYIKEFKIISQDAEENLDENIIEENLIIEKSTQEQIPQANETQDTINDENTMNIENQQSEDVRITAAVPAAENFDNVISLKEDFEEEQTDEETVDENVVYESSNEKSKYLIIYSILGLSILVNIILIWKR